MRFWRLGTFAVFCVSSSPEYQPYLHSSLSTLHSGSAPCMVPSALPFPPSPPRRNKIAARLHAREFFWTGNAYNNNCRRENRLPAHRPGKKRGPQEGITPAKQLIKLWTNPRLCAIFIVKGQQVASQNPGGSQGAGAPSAAIRRAGFAGAGSPVLSGDGSETR